MTRLIAILALALVSLSSAHAGVTCTPWPNTDPQKYTCIDSRPSGTDYGFTWQNPNWMQRLNYVTDRQADFECVPSALQPTWDSGVGQYVQNVKKGKVQYFFKGWYFLPPFYQWWEDPPGGDVTCIGAKPTNPEGGWVVIWIIIYPWDTTPITCSLTWSVGGYCADGSYFPPNW